MNNALSGDRNFDDLVDRFEKRIYKTPKGNIRLSVLSRDLSVELPDIEQGEGKALLDIGGGFGQFSIKFAKMGYAVQYNDLSQKMMEKARHAAKLENVVDQIQWHCGPYQTLARTMKSYDIVLCHAVIEWLEQPQKLIAALAGYLKPGGHLSLCFYNPVSMVYRNLLYGNFRRLVESDYQIKGGLTPTNPTHRKDVLDWLNDARLFVRSESGVRVFIDYVREKHGGNLLPEQILEQELQYSQLEPYKWMGRYLHVIAQAE